MKISLHWCYFPEKNLEPEQRRSFIDNFILETLQKHTTFVLTYETIKATPFGKKKLDPNPDKIDFNITHSKDLLAIAVGRNLSLGIDIERRDLRAFKAMKKFFTNEEITYFQTLSDTEKLNYFYDLWTAKEAATKCLGTGLRTPPAQFSADLNKLEVQIPISLIPMGFSLAKNIYCEKNKNIQLKLIRVQLDSKNMGFVATANKLNKNDIRIFPEN